MPAANSLPAPAPVKVTHSIFRRLFWQSVAVVCVTIILLGSLSFAVARSLLSERTLLQLSAVASSRKAIVEDGIRKDRERTALIAAGFRRETLPPAGEAGALLQSLEAQLLSDNIPVRGLTLFGLGRQVIQSVGVMSPRVFPTGSSTVLEPFVDPHEGWIANDVYAPLFDAHRHVAGYLSAHFDMHPTLASLFADTYLGKTGGFTLGVDRGGEMAVVQESFSGALLHAYVLGDAHDPFLADLPLTKAALGLEGADETVNERGEQVFAAYRFLPSLGWGMVVEVRRDEALQGLMSLGVTYLALSLLLLCFAGSLAYLLGRRLTSPLLSLSDRMRLLQPGSWDFTRSIHTGDEVEVLDAAITDLAARLKGTYDHLEEIVTQRTDELQKQYMLAGRILESIDYGILTVDPDGIVTHANPAALRLLQHAAEDIVGRKAIEVLLICQKGAQCPINNHPLLQVLEHGESYRSHPSMHLGVLRKDQTILPVTLTINPLLENAQLGAIVVFQDMTLERQLDYMKSEFISLASHQLRTPLSSIRWYMELLADEGTKDFTPSEQAYIEQIEHASRRMANLLEALLHVARLEGGGITPEYHKINIGHFLQRMAQEWQMTVREKNIRLHTSLLPDDVMVCTDPVLLQMILQNFLSNALKYSPEGSAIELGLLLHEDREVSVTVTDRGVGIPVDEQPRLFEKFFRARNVRHMDTDGTGLGLYICKSIADSLSGRITFTSSEGQGTAFKITVPVCVEGKCGREEKR